MVRYKTTGNIEAEYEPGSSVLKNKLGIKSKRVMDAKEYVALEKTQERFFAAVTPDLAIDLALIREIHTYFLGTLYAWAGQYRTVNISKQGFVWPPANLVAQNMEAFERQALRVYTPCRPGPIKWVADDIARIHAEFLLAHPFREGNGRVARILAGMMALQAGYYPPDFGFHSAKNRARYLRVVKAGYLGDYGELARMVIEAIKRAERKVRGLKGGGDA